MTKLESGGHDQDQLVLHEGFGANTAVTRGAFDQADRDLVVKKEMHNFAGISAMERELHAGMFAEEGSEQPGRTYCAMVVDTPSVNSPEILPSSGAKFLLGFGNQSCNFLGVNEKNGSLWSEGDAIAGAIEETNAKIVFERLDLKCDGGWVRKRCSAALRKFKCSATVRNTLRRKFSS